MPENVNALCQEDSDAHLEARSQDRAADGGPKGSLHCPESKRSKLAVVDDEFSDISTACPSSSAQPLAPFAPSSAGDGSAGGNDVANLQEIEEMIDALGHAGRFAITEGDATYIKLMMGGRAAQAASLDVAVHIDLV